MLMLTRNHCQSILLNSRNIWKLANSFKNNVQLKKGYCLDVSKKTITSGKIKICFGLMTGSAVALLKFSNIVNCDAGKGTRIVGMPKESKDPPFNWSEFGELLRPYLLQLTIAIIAALLAAFLNISIPRMSGEMINVIAECRSDIGTFLSRIKRPAIRFAALDLTLAVTTFVFIDMLSRVGEGMAKTLKNQLFSSLILQDIAFFDKRRTGELMSRLTVDIGDFKSSFKMVVSQGLRNTAQIIGCSITLFLISPQLTALMLFGIPTIIVCGTIFGTFLRKISGQAKAQNMKVTLIADEAFSNIRTVRAFSMESSEIELFDNESEKLRVLNERLGTGIAFFQAGSSLFLNAVVLSTFYAGGCLMAEERINPGDLVAFLTALQILQRSVTQLALLFGTYIKGIHAGARVFEMIDKDRKFIVKEGKTIPYHSLIPDIEFRDVTFAYPGRSNQDVLRQFSLKVPVGKTVALVGSSGSGKSTVAWLLQKFYDIPKNAGSIFIGGKDLKDLNGMWLRKRVIGLIAQEPILFATSIMENIRYGKPEATDQEVIEAAKLANADDFIRNFPDGYDTVVGERGASISGGQKQRIAIARALLKNPSILILDEATSALDTESEKLVQQALEKVMDFRTTIVIAHRLSTIKNADLIVVLSKGVIIESGTHAELMGKKGVYSNFVEQQKLAGQE